jgi:hypothetical protein
MITSSDDDQIVVFDCEGGLQKRMVNSQVRVTVRVARFFLILYTKTGKNTPTYH